MNLIIFGGSGRTGVELIRQLLQPGHHVTAFVRRRDRLSFQHKNLTVIEGDLTNAGQVRSAISGKDAVISALGVSKTLHHDPIVIDGIATIVKAMALEHVSRFIYISVFLANNKPGQFSFFSSKVLRRIIDREVYDHEVKEQLIRDHVKEYTIVRPVTLTNKSLTGKYRHGENLVIKSFLSFISRADVAHFILQHLTSPAYRNKAVVLAGS